MSFDAMVKRYVIIVVALSTSGIDTNSLSDSSTQVITKNNVVELFLTESEAEIYLMNLENKPKSIFMDNFGYMVVPMFFTETDIAHMEQIRTDRNRD